MRKYATLFTTDRESVLLKSTITLFSAKENAPWGLSDYREAELVFVGSDFDLSDANALLLFPDNANRHFQRIALVSNTALQCDLRCNVQYLEPPLRATQILKVLESLVADKIDLSSQDLRKNVDIGTFVKSLRWPALKLLRKNSCNTRLATIAANKILTPLELSDISGSSLQNCLSYMQEVVDLGCAEIVASHMFGQNEQSFSHEQMEDLEKTVHLREMVKTEKKKNPGIFSRIREKLGIGFRH